MIKISYAKIILPAMMVLLAASHAPALDPVLRLKDSERGTTAGLYPTGVKEDKELLRYVNERFGYSVKVPYEVFTKVVVIPDNDDGIMLQSKDGQYRFRASGGFVMSDDMLEASLKNAKEYVAKHVEGAQVFEKKGKGWWTLSWWNGPEKGGRKFLTNGEVWCDIEITWPGQPHNAPGAYDVLLEHALESLALSAASEAPVNEQPRTASPGERNARIIGFNSVLLGAFIAGEWVSAGDLQGKTKYHMDRIWGGHGCKVYSSKGFEGEGTLSAIHSEHPGEFENAAKEPVGQIFDVQLANGQSLKFGSARLAIACDWNPAPRRAVALDTKNAVYNKIVKDYLARNGLPEARPNIVQLFRVDLEGDGVDEVVIVAQNIVGKDTRAVSWEADRPLSLTAGLPGGSKKGEYSLILLRKIIDGKVREIPLAQFIAPQDSWPDETPVLHKVYQFADLNGDGVMEILAGADSRNGFKHLVYEIRGGQAAEALRNGALTGMAPGVARWMETAEFREPGVDTFVLAEKTKVYAAPDVRSQVVGELNTNPGGAWDVYIVQVRILLEGSGRMHKGWGRIARPLQGWVEWENLAISQSGFIGELIELPGDFKEVAPSGSSLK